MQDTVKRRATYADLKAVPSNLVAEILNGRLVTHPRPAPPHGTTATSLTDELVGPFQKRKSGPGGWVFIAEPELHLGEDVAIPELAGWLRTRMTTMPAAAFVELVPDWVCEVLSPSTEAYDRGEKSAIYARSGIPHFWIIDPLIKKLEVYELRKNGWHLLQTVAEHQMVVAPPFDAVPFSLGMLWPFDDPPSQHGKV
jgi:Uma2 family endonuclease